MFPYLQVVERMLFIYAKLNPGVSYVQVIIYLAFTDKAFELAPVMTTQTQLPGGF